MPPVEGLSNRGHFRKQHDTQCYQLTELSLGQLTTETGSMASCLTGTGSNMSILLVKPSRVF